MKKKVLMDVGIRMGFDGRLDATSFG
jgi:hypothetical protein